MVNRITRRGDVTIWPTGNEDAVRLDELAAEHLGESAERVPVDVAGFDLGSGPHRSAQRSGRRY